MIWVLGLGLRGNGEVMRGMKIRTIFGLGLGD